MEEDSHTLVVDINLSHHHRHLTFLHKDLHISLLKTFLHKTPLKASSMNAQAVRFVENLDMEHWIVTIGWTLTIKAKILLPSLLPWQVHPMLSLPAIKIHGLLILELLITSLLISTVSPINLSIKGLSKLLWEMVSLCLSTILVTLPYPLNTIISSLKMSFMCQELQ